MTRNAVAGIVAILLLAGVLLYVSIGAKPSSSALPAATSTKIYTLASSSPASSTGINVDVPAKKLPPDAISILKFGYSSDAFSLQKTIYQGKTSYSYVASNAPSMRFYLFTANDPTTYTEGSLNGTPMKAFILNHVGGANMADLVLFIFKYNPNKGAWEQVASTKIAGSDGTTKVTSFKIQNDTIAIDEVTAGKKASNVYKLNSNNQLLLQQ